MADRPPLALSVLDQSPIAAGCTPVDAVRQTVELAQLTEHLGYTRYWLAEHHSSGFLAGASPEIMVARVASATSTMRVGSGGVMLQHYSPFKVAENFRVLEALFPGRIDLGIGRAPGGNAHAARALGGAEPSVDGFARQIRDLAGYLHDALPADHPFSALRVTPAVSTMPQLWMLGSTEGGATFAAYFGLAFSFAHFINSSGVGLKAMALYRARFQPQLLLREPRGSVAVRVMCADTEAEAVRLASIAARLRVRMRHSAGTQFAAPTPEELVASPIRDNEQREIERTTAAAAIGAPEQVRERLQQLASTYGVEEVVVLTISHDPAARRRSYQLLAEVFELAPRPALGCG